MRTRRGLPFTCTLYMKLILKSILARVQRDDKLELLHDVWMGNHAHLLVKAKDAQQCKNFYGELQKQLTEAVKRLLGVEHMNLWAPNATSVVEIVGLESVIERIAYLYANPARANLVESIDDYPGLSSWRAFQDAEPRLDAAASEECRWVRQSMISPLPARSVTHHQDRHLVESMRSKTKTSHTLTYRPNAWMKEFGITTAEEIAAVNARIIAKVREYESEARTMRLQNRWRVKGARRLEREAIDLSYRSKKETRRIFIYAVDDAVRIEKIAEMKWFDERCRYCYERWLIGDYGVQWPPGAFRPPLPGNVNWFTAAP